MPRIGGQRGLCPPARNDTAARHGLLGASLSVLRVSAKHCLTGQHVVTPTRRIWLEDDSLFRRHAISSASGTISYHLRTGLPSPERTTPLARTGSRTQPRPRRLATCSGSSIRRTSPTRLPLASGPAWSGSRRWREKDSLWHFSLPRGTNSSNPSLSAP